MGAILPAAMRFSFLAAVLLCLPGGISGQVFDNLEALGSRLSTGDPSVYSTWDYEREGPKGLAAGDVNGDGAADLAIANLDGTVTVYLNAGDGRFSEPLHVPTETRSLRGIAIADLTLDGRPDIAVAALGEGLRLFPNAGGGSFHPALVIPPVAPNTGIPRNVATGDFDGDGALELAAGGSQFGLRLYRRTGEGAFSVAGELRALDAGGLTKPVYALKPIRVPGSNRDELVVTHAFARSVWVVAVGSTGLLEIRGEVADVSGVYSLDAGPITTAAGSGMPDLVTAHRDLGVVQVRSAAPGPSRFESTVRQEISIPGAPRAVKLVDLDGDGWNDVVVALRFLNRVLTYRNAGGTLEPATEMPVGLSPRELAAADFNRDGRQDIAVINRVSGDVSILQGHAGQTGFSVLDQVYLVDGDVSGLQVLDWNKDGRDDVVQLHRASADLSVRISGPDGTLGAPSFHAMGSLPGAQEVVDVNSDGLPDIVVASLGETRGSISVRLGQPGGGLGPETVYRLPEGVEGRFFSLSAADFDGDGALDLAAGFVDCRLAFYRGNGDGSFTFTKEHFFVYEARVMVVGDFDGDGDTDLAGAGYAGEVVVIENRGDLMTAEALTRKDYPSPSDDKFGTRDIKTADLNGDGDLDLVVGSGEGAMIYLGLDGMDFVLSATTVDGTEFPASSLALADFDGDGRKDLAVSCQVLSCISLLVSGPGGAFVPALSVDVPAGRLLGAGDLDGDGHADLVGTGDVLWTALSSRRAQRSGPPVLVADREVPRRVVINEILAINNAWPVAADGGRFSDWVEVYNGTVASVSLSGWRLELTPADAAPGEMPRVYTFPDGALGDDAHRLVIFSNDRRSQYHTGFRLPGEGGTLRLIDSGGVEADRLDYREQRENNSYSRYRDGLSSFVFNNFPSPAGPNHDNGAVPPTFKLRGAFFGVFPADWPLRPPVAGAPIRFLATGSDDVGIVSVSVLWQRIDVLDPAVHRVILYDDGMHEDGGMQDGDFAGVLEPGLPAGAEVRFQVEVTDLSDNVMVLPDGGAQDDADSAGFYSLAVATNRTPIEISELVTQNESGLRDEFGGTPDWVEVRNCGSGPASLDGVFLGERFPDSDRWFEFPAGTILQPGQHLIVYCDGNETQGALHAPFNLESGGGTLFIVGTTPSGAHEILDVAGYGAQAPDRAFARAVCGGELADAAPTPGEPNLAQARIGDVDANGILDITDPIVILNYLFLGESIRCLPAADANSDARVDLSDAVYVLSHLFLGGPPSTGAATGCAI